MSLLPPIFQDISNLALEKCALLVLKLDIKKNGKYILKTYKQRTSKG